MNCNLGILRLILVAPAIYSVIDIQIWFTTIITVIHTLLHVLKNNLKIICLSAVNKQLNDKERVAAALENPNLVDMVAECLAPSYG